MSDLRIQLAYMSPERRRYGLQNLSAHLATAGQATQLSRRIADFGFIHARANASGPQALIEDYDLVLASSGDMSECDRHSLRLIQGAIRLSAHILTEDLSQLRSHLAGRLLSYRSSNIQTLRGQIVQWEGGPWLRLLNAALTPPDKALVRTIRGPDSDLRALAVTADGRHIIAISRDGMLGVWDFQSGMNVRTLKGHKRSINAVAITPDGRRVVAASSDDTVIIWHIAREVELLTLKGHTDCVSDVAVTPDGRRVVSASRDQTLRVWDIGSGQEVRTLKGHLMGINAVAVTPDGRLAISGSDDWTVKVWDIESGDEVRTLKGHLMGINAVAVTPDGRLAISGSDDWTVKVWDIESGDEVRTLRCRHPVEAVAVTSDGRRAISGRFGAAIVWDVDSGKQLLRLVGHGISVHSMAVTRDGRRIVGALDHSAVGVWDMESGCELLALRHHDNRVTSVALTPDDRFAVSGSSDKTMKVWTIGPQTQPCTNEGHDGPVTAVAVTPDGRFAISGSSDCTVKVWDIDSGDELRTLTGHHSHVTAVAVTPDGRFAISGSGERRSKQSDNSVRIWDIAAGREVSIFEGHPEHIESVAVTCDGRSAVSASFDGGIKVWDIESGKELRTLENDEGRYTVTSIAITRAGHVICGLLHGALAVWDIDSGRLLDTLEAHKHSVCWIGATADGRLAVSASRDHTLKVWDIKSRGVIASFTAEAPLCACATSRDGRTFIAGDTLGRIYMLRLDGMEELAPGPQRHVSYRTCESPTALMIYAPEDGEAIAMALRQRLERDGPTIRLWRDSMQLTHDSVPDAEIIDRLRTAQHLVMVVTPAVLRSARIRDQWLRARHIGISVCPVRAVSDTELNLVELPRWMREPYFYDLQSDWEAFLLQLERRSKVVRVPFMAPALRTGFPEWTPQSQELLERLRNPHGESVIAVTSELEPVSSEVAAAVCHRDETIDTFGDGILWITLGDSFDVLERLTTLYMGLTGDSPNFADTTDAMVRLDQELADKRCLIVIDDVRKAEHLRPFIRGGKSCTRLVTSRQFEFAIETIFETIEAKMAALPDSDRRRYRELAIFPKRTEVPLDTVRSLWRLSKSQTGDLVKRLHGSTLLEFNVQASSIRLYEAARIRLAGQLTNAAAVHSRLVDGWGDPHKLPDTYAWRHIGYHLARAGREDELSQLLTDFEWVQAKLAKTDATALLAEYDFCAHHDDVRLVRDAIQLSWHVLATDKTQWAGQLLGRLLPTDSRRVQRMLEQAKLSMPGARLLPLSGCLTPAGGPLLRVLSGHKGGINCVAATSDGRLAVSASSDHTLRVWNLETGECIQMLKDIDYEPKYDWGVNVAAVTPDGRRAFSASRAGTPIGQKTWWNVKAWNLDTGDERRVHLPGSFVAMTPDAGFAVSAELISSGSDESASGVLRLMVSDLETGKRIQTVDMDIGEIDPIFPSVRTDPSAVALTGDGRRAISAIEGNFTEDWTLSVWDLRTGAKIRTLKGHTDTITSISVTPDGRRAISASRDKTLKVWDLETGKGLYSLVGHSAAVEIVVVTSDGRHAISKSDDNTMRVWDLETREETRKFVEHDSISSMTVTPDNRRVIGASGSTLKIWEFHREGDIHIPRGHASFVDVISLTPDGRFAISGSGDSTLKVWDIEKGIEVSTLEGHTGTIRSILVTPDGRHVISASYDVFSSDNALRVWDLKTGVAIRVLRGHSRTLHSAAMTPDGRFAVSASGDKTLKVWSLETWKAVRTLVGHTDAVGIVAMTSDGRRAISASYDDTLRVWDLQTGKEIYRLVGHTSIVDSISVTPDGDRMISASWDKTLKVWDLETGEEMCTLTGHTDRVTTVSVTPDGRCAISASWDKSLKVWDLETGKEIHSLVGHTDAVRCASLTPDGRFAISVSNDNTVKAWDLDNGMSIARFVSDGSLYTCAVAPDGKTIIAGGALGSVHILRLEGTDAGAVRVTDDQSTLTPEHSGKSSRAYTRFVRRLSDVSQVLNVPYSAVTEWRDERKCPILEKAPYNIEALKNWLTQQANLQIDYSSELARRKLETEVRKLEGEGRVFSRDKSFWIAVAALGITVTREVREWLEGSNFAGPADKADKKAESLELQKAKAEHRKRLRRFSVAEHAGFHYPDVPASPAHASPGPFDRELSDLAKAVVLGETDRAVGLVHCLLDAGLTGQDILNQGVFAGMSVVGEKFKRHEILVPEVLLSARVMKVCFEKLKLETPSSSVQHVGKAVIGTVRGDLHDIGKSLVAVMMRGRGVKVIDLGTDVAADSFLQTLSEENAQLLCLSALLTKTVAGINEVIEILSGREDLDHVKVLIGGASVRPEHAEQYAADGYGEDATTGAELAVGLLRSQKPSVRVQRRQ